MWCLPICSITMPANFLPYFIFFRSDSLQEVLVLHITWNILALVIPCNLYSLFLRTNHALGHTAFSAQKLPISQHILACLWASLCTCMPDKQDGRSALIRIILSSFGLKGPNQSSFVISGEEQCETWVMHIQLHSHYVSAVLQEDAACTRKCSQHFCPFFLSLFVPFFPAQQGSWDCCCSVISTQ